MKYSVYCKNCNYTNTIRSNSIDRVELEKEYTNNIEVTCLSCNETHIYNVNNVFATLNKGWHLFLTVITLFATVIVAYYILSNYWGKSFYIYLVAPSISSIPSMIYFVYLKNERKKVRLFNRYRK
jgi:hypothetical protein